MKINIKYFLFASLLIGLLSCGKQSKKKESVNANDTIVRAKKDLLKVYDKQIRAYYLNLTEI